MHLTCFYISEGLVAKGVKLLQETLETNVRRFKNFLGYSRGFILRRNPLKAFAKELTDSIKDFILMNKKLRMSRYRLNYHKHQLQKMEALIAENNEHMFLKGKNINQVR